MCTNLFATEQMTGAGDDTIDASTSTHPVILFGERGLDQLFGGSGSDIVLGKDDVIPVRNSHCGQTDSNLSF